MQFPAPANDKAALEEGTAFSPRFDRDGLITAIVTDGARRVVYVVDDKNVVQARPVEMGAVVDGLRVIRSGLRQQERVIVNGIQRARPGAPVQAQPGRIGPDGQVITPQPQGQQGGGQPQGGAAPEAKK